MLLTYSYEKFALLILRGIKVHTIREDKSNRWKAGRTIHHWMHNPRNKSKNPYFFQQGTCISTQIIKITWLFPGIGLRVEIDGRELYLQEKEILAVNDGFENWAEFKLHFNSDFTGKIIHFTNLKY